METFELRYFLGIAKNENIHRASEELSVSPASLSKAISRLEDELGVSLFYREGRNIRLTDHGRLLQKRASQMIQIEESTKAEISGHKGTLNVVISGSEVILSGYSHMIIQAIQKRIHYSRFELKAIDDEEAIRQVEFGESHLAIVTSAPERGFRAKNLGQTKFVTCLGKGHPLYKRAQRKDTVPVEALLEHPFVSPSLPILGEIGARQSMDGWRDDKFPRNVAFRTASLKLIEELVAGGRALAYLPEYLVERAGATALKVSGCPYSCVQNIHLIARTHPDIGWINQLFSDPGALQ